MKIKLIQYIIFTFITASVMAQYPCYNGISTNPLNPINTQLPSKTNTFFNWQDSIWQQRILTTCGRDTAFQESPFFKTDNLEELRVAKDMKWEDGWELILRRFGLTETNSYSTDPHPNMITVLYNRYTGILRILLKACNGQDYNAARISLQFSNLTTLKTDLLEFTNNQMGTLTKKFIPSSFTTAVIYSSDKYKWFYADFPMMYDPCTCMYASKLNITSNLITTATINLEGTITGDIQTKNVNGKAEVQKAGTFGWKDFGNLVNGKLTAVNSSITAFKKYTQDLADNIGQQNTDVKKAAIDSFAKQLANSKFLKTGLSYVPWLKSAVNLIDVFSAGGKTGTATQEVKLLPLSVNLTAKISGTLSTTNLYHNVTFTNPGSKNAELDPPIYPYYNEVLGIFNLLSPPEFWYEKRVEDLRNTYSWMNCPVTPYPNYGQCPQLQVNVHRFKLDTATFKYILNPAAGLTIQNMKLSLVTETDYTPSYYQSTPDPTTTRLMTPDFDYEGKDPITGDFKFSTNELLHSKNFAKRTWRVINNSTPYIPYTNFGFWNVYSPKGISSSDSVTAYLKVVLNLRRNVTSSTTQNVLYIATFPVKLKQGNQSQYWENDVSYRYGTPEDTTLILGATPTEVINFCNSSVYFNPDRQGTPITQTQSDSLLVEQRLRKAGMAIFPNPNNGTFNVRFKPSTSVLNSYFISDMLGKRIYTSTVENLSLSSGLTKQITLNLSKGSYVLTAITNGGKLNARFIVLE